jgi:putative transposase
VVESFMSSLKKERIKKRIYPSRDIARADIADYIDTFYNRTRRHSHLGGVGPEESEAAHKSGRRRASA